MKELHSEIVKLFEKYPDVLFGFSNIEFSEYRNQYKCSIVFAVPHTKFLTLNTYTEESFEALIIEARETVNLIHDDLRLLFSAFKIKFEFPPLAQSSEETLLAPFSFKFAAVNAGLGWIGKNDVLITDKYGPRIRLSAVLVDCDLPIGIPVSNSRCLVDCFQCVKACPCHALTGNTWNITSQRDELINYFLCNKMRSSFINTHHRKNSCGLCFVSCPIGL